jgi:hypothetical protein
MCDELGDDTPVIATIFRVPDRVRLLRDRARRMSERAWFAHEADLAAARERRLAALSEEANVDE